MAEKVGVDSLEAAIARIERQYGEEVDARLRSDMQYIGEFTANEVTRNSAAFHDTGEYQRGWDYKYKASKDEIKVVVGNSGKHAPLTHLLEKGHMNRDGSWTGGRKHIEPAYDKAVEVLDRRLNE